MTFFLHEKGLCESPHIGDGTRVWAFTHILPGARVGRDCNLCDFVFLENDVVLGDRVTVKCHVMLCDGVNVEVDVFIGPNAVFTNDPHPRSKQHLSAYPKTVLCKGTSIGANATTKVKRSDFNMGKNVPYVSDEVSLTIAVEAIKE